jgi:hypothetical protein
MRAHNVDPCGCPGATQERAKTLPEVFLPQEHERPDELLDLAVAGTRRDALDGVARIGGEHL